MNQQTDDREIAGTAGTTSQSEFIAALGVFCAEYSETCWGEVCVKAYAVVANTKAEALGLVLESEPKTKSHEWTITEIDLTKPVAHYINSYN